MSYWPANGDEPVALHGANGKLVFVRVQVDSRLLEDLLEALARADFPINPEIRHGYPDTHVEFPAYDSQIPEIQRLIQSAGLRDAEVELANALRAIA
jgi:hypothetical protein